MKKYYFKMQATDKDGTATGSAISLEDTYSGLYYVKCEGLETVGAPKNIYTEDYAESDGLRVYHPSDSEGQLYRKETEVKLTLLFTGEGRRDAYAAFRAFAEAGRLFYWDTARLKKVWLVLNKEVTPDEDILVSDGHLLVAFSFTNLWGIGKNCNENGTLL